MGVAGTVCAREAITVADPDCGITYQLPTGWLALHTDETRDNEAIVCSIEFRPSNWDALNKRSRWGAGTPVTLDVYAPRTPLRRALEDSFEPTTDGGWRIDGRFGYRPVSKYWRGSFRGLVGYSGYRGFIKDADLLRDGESGVYSGESVNIVARHASGRVIAISHACGSPDVQIDCDAAVTLFIDTVKFRTPKGKWSAIRERQMERVGRTATDCGDVPLLATRDEAERCMVTSFDARRPFAARFRDPASHAVEGIALSADGQIFVYRSEAIPVEIPCTKPYVWRDGRKRRLACAEPSFNEEFPRSDMTP